MPRIEFEISDLVYADWKDFLRTEPAGRLMDGGMLGDWVAMGFMAEVNRYMDQGAPIAKATQEEEQDKKAVDDRRNLTKPQKRVLPMFNENDTVTVSEIGRLLGIELGQCAGLVASWVGGGFFVQSADRGDEATFTLAPDWQQHNLMANRPSLNVPRAPFLPAFMGPGLKTD